MQIYLLTFQNSKKYVGITSKTAAERFREHCCEKQRRAVHHAIHKYGKENVTVTVLATLNATAEDYDICWKMLCVAEQRMIAHYDTFGENGYNMTLGGDGSLLLGIYGEARRQRDSQLKKRYYQEHSEHTKARQKKYRDNNPEITRSRKRKYYEANKDAVNATKKLWYEENKVENAARRKEHYRNNKEQIAAASRKYREEHKEALAAKSKEKYAANREAILAQKKEYLAENKEAISERRKQYRLVNRDKINAKQRERKAAKKALTLKAQNALIEEI